MLRGRSSLRRRHRHRPRARRISPHAACLIRAATQAARTKGAAEALANALPGRNLAGTRVKWDTDTKLKNKVQLTAYPDCIGDNLADLEAFVSKNCEDVVHGMHVLPFYPSSADRGFAPITYQEVDEQFGTWEDVKRMSAERDFCVDFMVNHCSAQSAEFLDFKEKKDEARARPCLSGRCHRLGRMLHSAACLLSSCPAQLTRARAAAVGVGEAVHQVEGVLGRRAERRGRGEDLLAQA